MSAKLRKSVLWIGFLAVIGGATYYAMRPQPVPVDLAPVLVGPMEVTIDSDAMTKVRHLFEISAPVTGTVLRSDLTLGQQIKAGDLIASITPSQPALMDARSRTQAEGAVAEAEAALHLSQTQLEQAHVALEFAQASYDRAKALFDRGAIPHENFDSAELHLAQQKAAVRSAEEEVQMREGSLTRARALLEVPADVSTETVQVRAPVDGQVLEIAETSERLVLAGAPLVKIGRLDDLELVADILSTDATRLQIGTRAYVERWGGPYALEATLRRIEPSAFTKVSALGISEQRVTVTLDFDLPDAGMAKLGDGYHAYVRIVEWSGDDVTQVPISALFREGAQWSVFRVLDGRAALTPVEVGHRNLQTAEILSGVSGDEQVITHPSDRVADGVLVVDRNEL